MWAVTTEERRLDRLGRGRSLLRASAWSIDCVVIACANALREEQSLNAINMAGALRIDHSRVRLSK